MEKFNVSNWEATAEKAIEIVGQTITECADVRMNSRYAAEQLLKENGFGGALLQVVPGIDQYLISCSIVVNYGGVTGIKYTQEKIFQIY